MTDTLRKRVLEYDRLHNTPREMRVTMRSQWTARICVQCRRTPTREGFRAWWLAANPLATHYCELRRGCEYWRTWNNELKRWREATRAEHRARHEEQHVRVGMPPSDELPFCPFCGGALAEVTW